MNTTSSTSIGSKEEAIHAKTRGLQAEFRQQRDKAHHAYQVASEKLQTSIQNAQDIQKVVQDKQERLANIEESKQELQKKMSIGHKVAGLKKEVRIVATTWMIPLQSPARFCDFLLTKSYTISLSLSLL